MIRLLLFGALGRMGRMTSEELSKVEDISLSGAVEAPGHPGVGSMIEGVAVKADSEPYSEADVWLDFSLALPAMEHARRAAELGKPLAIAATGFTSTQEEEISWLAKRCPILLAPNLSAGVGVLENLAATASRMLPESFDASISEAHHRTKKDAPSGTAKRIAALMEAHSARPDIVSIRGGGAIGEHRVIFSGENEELLLVHRAWSRKAFASGVPRALRFIVRMQAGLYSHQDIYGE